MRPLRLIIVLLLAPMMLGAARPTPKHGPPHAPARTLWTQRYNGPNDALDDAFGMGVNPAGTTVFVTGLSDGGAQTGIDIATIAYRAGTGRMLWLERYTGPGASEDAGYALAVSPDGATIFVTGSSAATNLNDDYITIAYDAVSGAELWVARYNGPGNGTDVATAIGLSSDGSRVFITGESVGLDGTVDYATVAYDSATGVQLWVARHSSFPGATDYGAAVAVSPDGTRVIVTGETCTEAGCNDYDFGTIAYDAATGVQLWLSTYDGPAHSQDFAAALRMSPDGSRVYVTGTGWGIRTNFDYETVAYDTATGTQLWVNRYDSPTHAYDYAESIDVAPDGTSVYVTGSAGTVGYNSLTGVQLWVAYTGASSFEKAIEATADGSRVYVTGWTEAPDFNYLAVGYDAATGTKVWQAVYQGPRPGGTDMAQAIGLSPTGQLVFITGQSTGVSSNYDYATIAYRP